MPPRNPAIEALRVLSVMQICIWHMHWPPTDAGFLGVEFFFILAGIFMYRNATRQDSPGVVDYTLHKLGKFWLKIVVVLVCAHIVFYQQVVAEFQHNWLYPILRFISESLLIQDTGLFGIGLNNPTWFFSVLIYGGALVYALTKYYTKLSIRLIFPLLALFYLAFTSRNGTQEALEDSRVIGFIPMEMARGVCEMGLGVVIGYLYFNYSAKVQSYRSIWNAASAVALILYLAIIANGRQFSQYAFIFIPTLIGTALTPGTWLSRLFSGNYWRFLGRISFDIFIIHWPLNALFRHFLHVEAGMDLWIVATLYYLSLVPAAFAFDRIVASFQFSVVRRLAER